MVRVGLLFVVLGVGLDVDRDAPRVTLNPSVIPPGEFFVITVEPPGGETVQTVRAGVLDFHPRFYRFGEKWKAVGAVSAKTPPGRYPVYVKVGRSDGTELETKVYLTVTAKRFPRQRIRMSAEKMRLRTAAALARDKAKLDQAIAESAPQPLWEGNFILPVRGRFSTGFGVIRTVNGQDAGRHYGLDIAAPAGTPIKATNHGRVTLAEMLETHGNTIVIDHGCGVFSLYLHLSRIDVQVGDEVRKGQVIGRVGTTGFSTGPHLHWGVRVAEVPTNPWRWMQAPPKL
ncbi:MAG: M23 family metallopeptidase [Abditibacteriales bacterium]|nr:M23 family metallopeptidase [Abditibacteriales bacterium]MDW8367915.1 M23 family metallopeptidase [Abditibacteriales bacterium]